MGTKLGPVDIPLRLDTAEAARQLRFLQHRIEHTQSLGGFSLGIAGAGGAGLGAGGAGRRQQIGGGSAAAAGGNIGLIQAMQRPAGEPTFGGLYNQGMGFMPQGSVLGKVMRAGYTTSAIMQGVQTPLDLMIAASNAIPVYGGAIAFGAQITRLQASVGAPIVKGMLEGFAASGAIKDQETLQQIKKVIDLPQDIQSKASVMIESWNESVKPTISKMISVGSLVGQVGGPVNVGSLAQFGMRAFQVESADNMINRRFRQWRLQYAGESIGSAIRQVMIDSFAPNANK